VRQGDHLSLLLFNFVVDVLVRMVISAQQNLFVTGLVENLRCIAGEFCIYAARTTLINVSLFNSTIYHMSVYLLTKTIIKRLDKSRRKFFWGGGGEWGASRRNTT
jgi:hypothetical protein